MRTAWLGRGPSCEGCGSAGGEWHGEAADGRPVFFTAVVAANQLLSQLESKCLQTLASVSHDCW